MKKKHLGEFEEIVLLTIGILGDTAYGVKIRDEMEERIDRRVGLGALHATLVRLEDKGLVNSEFGEASQKRGGKRKRFYQVTAQGERALLETRTVRDKLWEAYPDISLNPGLNFSL